MERNARRAQRVLAGMAYTLEGTVALVTGASSGIGEATALRLAAEGAKVAVCARRADRLDALVERVHQGGREALAIEADITDASGRLIAKASSTYLLTPRE